MMTSSSRAGDSFNFNLDVADTVFEQEDTLDDVEDDLFGESAGDAIDDVFGFGGADEDVVYGADVDVGGDSGAEPVQHEMPEYAVPTKTPKKKAAATATAPAVGAPTPPPRSFHQSQGGGGGGGGGGADDGGPEYAEPDEFFAPANTGHLAGSAGSDDVQGDNPQFYAVAEWEGDSDSDDGVGQQSEYVNVHTGPPPQKRQ